MSIKKKALCLALAASIAGASFVGCSGQYALFHKAHQFCGNLGGKWIGAVVNFVAMAVIPVYGICLLADFLILNTIEFWTGSNPVAYGDTYEETDEHGTRIAAVKNADGTLSVNIVDVEGNVADFVMEREGNEIRILDANGTAIAFHKYFQ